MKKLVVASLIIAMVTLTPGATATTTFQSPLFQVFSSDSSWATVRNNIQSPLPTPQPIAVMQPAVEPVPLSVAITIVPKVTAGVQEF